MDYMGHCTYIVPLLCDLSHSMAITTLCIHPSICVLPADLDQTCSEKTFCISQALAPHRSLPSPFPLTISLRLTSGEPGQPAIQRLLGRRPQHLLLMGFLVAIFLLPILSQVILSTTQRIIISIRFITDLEHASADGDYFPPLNLTLGFACPRKLQ
jgi:hypothetical protein